MRLAPRAHGETIDRSTPRRERRDAPRARSRMRRKIIQRIARDRDASREREPPTTTPQRVRERDRDRARPGGGPWMKKKTRVVVVASADVLVAVRAPDHHGLGVGDLAGGDGDGLGDLGLLGDSGHRFDRCVRLWGSAAGGRTNGRTDGHGLGSVSHDSSIRSRSGGGAPRAIEDFSSQSPRSMMMYSHAHPWAGYFFCVWTRYVSHEPSIFIRLLIRERI